jgi:4'-phosphopantetheinyl transferase
MFQNLEFYQVRLDISAVESDRLWQLLSEEERSRANRYKHEYLRRNFIAARGNLRKFIAQNLGCDPQKIEFGYGDRGKPYIQNVQGIPDHQKLFFNIAHSQNLAIYVLSSDREVGIDLEYINLECDVEKIAKRYFLPSEQQIIADNQDQHLAKYLAFYRIWTLKEAYGKATGQGIANILDVVDVGSLVNMRVGESLHIYQSWALKLLDLDPNYAAAICVAIAPS